MKHKHTAGISDVGRGVRDVLLLGRRVVLGDRFLGRMQCFLMLQQVVRIVTTGL
jgi:hypothetical protein